MHAEDGADDHDNIIGKDETNNDPNGERGYAHGGIKEEGQGGQRSGQGGFGVVFFAHHV